MDDENKGGGYGKPPKHTRFVKGRSGNPKGRPKRTRSVRTEVTELLGETVTIREGDRTRKVTKLRALLESGLSKPFKGDSRAAVSLLNWIVRFVDPNRDLNPEPVSLNSGPIIADKELTPAEKWEWLRELHDAFKDVRGLPAAARSALGEGNDEDGKDSAS
ncbi:MAG: DUF5681 domain-containing protein [Armatimonadota bacterium]|nr:DUF5681 domain-containing protein [Armatimonadota bacterium]